jgi:ABC-type cobalamin/Fe3+-siderophores transport system ATPase subunit
MNTDSSKPQGVSRLQVRGLRKSYEGHEVLKGINFKVNPGEIFVIMGPSSGGKTVLLRQLIGLEKPDREEALIEGEPIQPPEISILNPLPRGDGFPVRCSADLNDRRRKCRFPPPQKNTNYENHIELTRS